MSTTEQELRLQLAKLVTGEQSHMQFREAVAGFPFEHINTKPTNVAYSFWHLLEHIRKTQDDIIDFMTNPLYKELVWPEDYWPNA